MKKSCLLGAVGACFLSAVSISVNCASVITFEEFANPSHIWMGDSWMSQGYEIENLGDHPAQITGCSPPCASNGTQSLLNIGDGILRFSSIAGHAFTFNRFDAAESFSGQSNIWAGQLDIMAELLGGGIVQTSFILDHVNDGLGPPADFETFVLPSTFTDITTVTISGSGGISRNDFSVDNLSFTVSSIPIPPAIWLFGSGLVGLAAMARRKKV